MAESVLKIRVEGELAYIALNRPEKRNAINQAMLRAIPEALDELDRPEVRAIIIYGEGQALSAVRRGITRLAEPDRKYREAGHRCAAWICRRPRARAGARMRCANRVGG